MDEGFQPGAEPPALDMDIVRARTGGAWTQLASQEATKKENEQKAARFKGLALSSLRPGISRISKAKCSLAKASLLSKPDYRLLFEYALFHRSNNL